MSGRAPAHHDGARARDQGERGGRSGEGGSGAGLVPGRLLSVAVGASRASVAHLVPSMRPTPLPTIWMRGRPLGLTTTSEAMPYWRRHSTPRSALSRSRSRSAAGSRNGPTARGPMRSAVAPELC
jgi:hypothetical protein